MKMSVFKNIRSKDDLGSFLGVIKSYSDEHLVGLDKLLIIEDGLFDETRYLLSTAFKNFVHSNWFMFKQGNFYGLAKSRVCSTKLDIVIPANYISFSIFHENVWVAMRDNSTYDLYIYGKCVLSGILSYDVLHIEDCIRFVQIDTSDSRYLICCDEKNLSTGVFIPSSSEAFKNYFVDKICKLGYSGELDMYSVSSLFQLYYEIQNCIFCNGNFKYLEVVDDEN